MAIARILVVEDESIVALDIKSTLEGLGYDVTALASSGEEAVEKAAETRPDLVLMDIRLKGMMDGIQAAEGIRAHLDIPVVYLTAYADDRTLQRAKITGPFGYVLKPYEERELHTTIEMALYRHQAEKQLKTYAAKLEQSNRELQDFAYVASHDLQEPLRKIQAFGDRLTAKYSEALDEQGQDYLDRMQNAAVRMQGLINGLLTYSRVTTKAQPFAPVDLAQVAQEVMSDLEMRIDQVGGRVEIGHLPTIDADPLQMRQLLQNLIGNALKFYREQEAPVVKVYDKPLNGQIHSRVGDSPDARLCQIVVEDNGIGFEEKYGEQIFQVFERLHGRSQYEGAGMGLAICRKIAERHGGEITARSSPGRGATFIVTLPLEQPRGENGR